MAKSRAVVLVSPLQCFSRQLHSQHGNGADWVKILDIVCFGPHSATSVRLHSSGVIYIGTSRYLSTVSSGCEGTMECWQLTMGNLSRCGHTYSYEQSNDGGYSQVKQTDIASAKYPNKISQQSTGDKKIHFGTERKPRALEFTHTTSEALGVLKSRLQRGIAVDSHMYVDVLKRCSKQKDLLTAKQVHDFIKESGMDKNPKHIVCFSK
ncbi:unnamed protein product [Calypogeia fissa]